MVRLLEMLHGGELLSESSNAAAMDILERQQAATIIPYGLPPGTRTAHKTGGVTSVRCDVGIVFAPSGPYAIALMAKQVTDGKAIDRALAAVSEAVYTELGRVVRVEGWGIGLFPPRGKIEMGALALPKRKLSMCHQL